MNYNQIQQNINQGNSINNLSQKRSKDLYPDVGYGSSGSSQQLYNNSNYQNSINNNNYESNNYPQQNFYNQNQIQSNENERPLWSYREIKFDKFKMPMNTEEMESQKNLQSKNPEIPRKSELQENEQKYFNNAKYQKVKVIKKVKNSDNIPLKIQKKGPVDDYEQQYNIQNYNNNNEQENPQNIEYNDNQNIYNNINEQNQINNDNENNDNYEQNEENFENMNNEEDEEEGEIELEQKDIQDEYDKIIDDNEGNYNNQEPKEENNNLQNQVQKNEINDEEFQKENYDIDIENLAEANSENEKEENENVNENQKIINQNIKNKNESNNQIRPKPSFNETISQKVTDLIEDVKTFPEGNLESWNCVADYTP